MRRLALTVGEGDARERLDSFVARAGGISRGLARTLIERGGVWVDAKRTKVASRGLHPGQRVEVVLEESGRRAASPSNAALTVLFEDAALIAVDKPAGVNAQATAASDQDGLTARVARHLGLSSDRDVGLVHRLDRETSGVTVFGKTPSATAALALAFREGTVRKRYLAIAAGPLAQAQDVDAWIAKDPARPGLFRACKPGDGVPAFTRIEPLSAPGPLTACACLPRTGRTHQIRVHLASLQAPILGDHKYGGPAEHDGLRAERVLLHAEALALSHPETGAPLTLRAPWPADLAQVLTLLGVKSSP